MARLSAVAALLSIATTSHAEPIARPDLVRAHHEKVTGAALIGVGAALTLVGQIMFVVAATIPERLNAHCGPAGCGQPPWLNTDFVMLGAPLVAAGGALALAGTAVYVIGGRRKERAERATLTMAPQFDPTSATLGARLRF
ncbi:MAG TPA: hypothetical protein VGL86_16160 [Polyangia bacterium]|jgi:hypothetical protein